MNDNRLLKRLEELTLRREQLQKKQLMAYSNGFSQQIKNQLKSMIEEVDFELYNLTEIRRSTKDASNDSDDGLII